MLPLMGKDVNFLPLNTWLSLTKWGRSQAFFPLKCTAILPHMGKESCFLPWSASFPRFSPKCNATIPHKFSPYVGKDSSPFKMQNPHKMLPYKSSFFMLLLSIYKIVFFPLISFSFSLLFPLNFVFFHFSPKLGILPQSRKIIPQHLGPIIEE